VFFETFSHFTNVVVLLHILYPYIFFNSLPRRLLFRWVFPAPFEAIFFLLFFFFLEPSFPRPIFIRISAGISAPPDIRMPFVFFLCYWAYYPFFFCTYFSSLLDWSLTPHNVAPVFWTILLFDSSQGGFSQRLINNRLSEALLVFPVFFPLSLCPLPSPAFYNPPPWTEVSVRIAILRVSLPCCWYASATIASVSPMFFRFAFLRGSSFLFISSVFFLCRNGPPFYSFFLFLLWLFSASPLFETPSFFTLLHPTPILLLNRNYAGHSVKSPPLALFSVKHSFPLLNPS